MNLVNTISISITLSSLKSLDVFSLKHGFLTIIIIAIQFTSDPVSLLS